MSDAPTVSKEALVAELEQTREDFHQLLSSLTPEDMKQKSANPAWTVGQLMYHLAWGIGYAPPGIRRMQKEKDFNFPRPLLNLMNPWMTRWGAWRTRPEDLARKYDKSHEETLAVLSEVGDDEWGKSAKVIGELETMEQACRMPITHFREHQADILKGLGRL